MWHGFPAMGAVIDHDAISGICQSLCRGNFARGDQQVPENRGIRLGGLANPGDHLLRYHEEMHRCLGIDVPDGDAQVILVQDVGGDFPRDDLFEKGHESCTWSLLTLVCTLVSSRMKT